MGLGLGLGLGLGIGLGLGLGEPTSECPSSVCSCCFVCRSHMCTWPGLGLGLGVGVGVGVGSELRQGKG